MHVCLCLVDVFLCGGHPVVVIVTDVAFLLRMEETIYLEELAEVGLGCIAYLLGQMQVILSAVGDVSAHRLARTVLERTVVIAAALAHGILAEQLEEGLVEAWVVALSMIVEVELEVHTCLCPDAHVEPALSVGKVIEGIMHGIAACGAYSLQEHVHVSEEVVRHLGSSHYVDKVLVVVAHLVAGSPHGT